MTEPTPSTQPKVTPIEKKVKPVEENEKVTPLRCFLGAVISGGLTYFLYYLTSAIITTFAAKPVTADSQLAFKIATAVRTLVMGLSSLATFIFVFVTFGLILLGIQLLIQGNEKTVN
ncbi:DUF3082 domain-containing protein [Aphanothece hegewaldii CCALA 016]|uniref:DUF3082 domain-containing protein n=1 Tax=Aphanothece hegewaldii CCALA 016 TaxID=2107694 RepID=A0A2T1LXM9_9CHRO|nr:DUF3082 domain-containing protein [Aphanothece hegewaldii]PSF37144.1 DUF3082 domain-containing protein [Aphanothece hegewaldii CCALA 016]